MAFLLAAHALAVIVWVGGMFFAHMVLRPSAGPLDAAARLALWRRIFQTFFPWVWLCAVTILLSGFALIVMIYGGFARLPAYVSAMMALGIAMAGIFGYIYFGLWPRFRQAVLAEDWNTAETAIARIRTMVRTNLTFGLVAAVIGVSGRYFA